ncbi:hypothetical protein ACNQ05_21100 [Enterobacter cloacae complex sp.6701062]|nr:hypothetical protein [Enterobacter hormaechei]ELT0866752.1 hypothetical protein [Enterobacter hormaechei]
MSPSHSGLSIADNATALMHYRDRRAGNVNIFYREAVREFLDRHVRQSG